MDCCNYMQHRQSYYGSQYYENGPAYHTDFQHHQYASDMQQYGAPNWGFAASCSDYVYNPKEARIRKALRDRERSIVNSSTARSRRSNWSRQSPAPQMPPIAHGDPHMNIPSKEFRSVIRHELEHGFLHNNGGYIYPSQQYLFAPQSEYMSYINAIPSTNWPGNTYNMQNNNNNNNNMVQQQIWNQYQTDRVRSQQQQQQQQHQQQQQQQQNQSYIINAQGPQSDYQMEHMPPNNLQMGPSKSRMQQNIENAASDVDRYLNIPNRMRSPPRNPNPNATNIQLDEMPIQMQNQNNIMGNNDDSSVMSATATSSMSNESNARSIDVIGSQESTTSNNDMNISVVTTMSDVDGSINLDNSDNAESGFGGMQLFSEEVPSLSNTSDNRNNQMMGVHKEIKNKNPLPDFNEAFGSTERGRFQSPPDPRLGPEKEYLDFFNDNFTIKTEQYTKWVDTANTYTNNQNFNISF